MEQLTVFVPFGSAKEKGAALGLKIYQDEETGALRLAEAHTFPGKEDGSQSPFTLLKDDEITAAGASNSSSINSASKALASIRSSVETARSRGESGVSLRILRRRSKSVVVVQEADSEERAAAAALQKALGGLQQKKSKEGDENARPGNENNGDAASNTTLKKKAQESRPALLQLCTKLKAHNDAMRVSLSALQRENQRLLRLPQRKQQRRGEENQEEKEEKEELGGSAIDAWERASDAWERQLARTLIGALLAVIVMFVSAIIIAKKFDNFVYGDASYDAPRLAGFFLGDGEPSSPPISNRWVLKARRLLLPHPS